MANIDNAERAELKQSKHYEFFQSEPEFKKYSEEREKIMEANEYIEPIPIKYRREFWKYGLNPITGMRPIPEKNIQIKKEILE